MESSGLHMERHKMQALSGGYRMENSIERDELQNRWGVLIELKQKTSSWVGWNKPPMGTVKLNSDGTLQNGLGNWGAVLRDNNGVIIKAARGRSVEITIDAVELDGLLQGTELAIRNGYLNIDAEVDSTTVVYYREAGNPPWNLKRSLFGGAYLV